jgi:hypothetical protein
MVEQRLGILRQSYLSVTDFQFYCTIMNQHWRRSLRYLLFWVTVSSLFTAAAFLARFQPVMDQVGIWLAENLPTMEVSQGKLSTAVAVPHRVQMQQPDLRVVVDPSDSVRKASSPEGIEVIFNSDRIYLQIQGREDSYQFKPNDQFRIDREAIERWRGTLKWLFIPFSLLALWPYYLLAKSMQLVFLVGSGFFLTRPPKLSARQWLNISVYSLTPAILIGLIFQMSTVPVEIAWCFYLGTAMIYSTLAGRRCQTPPKPPDIAE